MEVYRIARSECIADLSGTGAKIVGGRWNPKGIALLYTSTSVSLSMLEVLVHLPPAFFPDSMALATLKMPDTTVSQMPLDALPKNWDQTPVNAAVQNSTVPWILGKKSLGIRVPSTIVPIEQNVLINPIHPDFKKLKLISVDEFPLDKRLLKSQN